MKLGIIGNYDEKSFKMAADKGLAFLELCINIDQSVNDFLIQLDQVKKYSKQYNVGIQSIGRWGTDRIDEQGNIIQEELEVSYQLIDAAKELGCRNFICGCNYVEALSYYDNCTAAMAYFSKLIEYAEDKSVKIATYNCRWNNFIHSDLAWTVIHGHIAELGIKYDPSHCRYHGGDYLSEMKKWGQRFYHVHIKGSLIIDGERFDDPPAGLDETNWGAFVAILYAHKYDQGLSIEPHSANWKGELGDLGVDFTVNYMKKLIV